MVVRWQVMVRFDRANDQIIPRKLGFDRFIIQKGYDRVHLPPAGE